MSIQVRESSSSVHDACDDWLFLSSYVSRWRLGVATFVLVFAVVAVGICFMPVKYQSFMKLLVKNDRQELVVSADNTVSSLHTSDISETQLNSEVELLKSEDILRQVVRQSGLDKVPLAHSRSTVSKERVQDAALHKLEKDLSIAPVKKSNVIQVSYQSRDPHMAASVLQHLADAYLTEHIRIHAAPGTYPFFRKQTADYEQRLAQCERELSSLRQQYSTFALPEEQATFMEHALDAQQAYERAMAQVAQYQNKAEEGRAKLRAVDGRIVTQTRAIPNPALVDKLTGMLAELRNRRTDLLVKFRPDDRLVQDVDQQIGQTEQLLAQATRQTLEEQSTDVNQVHQTIESGVVSAEMELAGLQSSAARLKATADSYNRRLYQLAGVSVRMDDLIRQVKENEQKYLLYATKREEARIADSLDTNRIANVIVAETPTVPVEPASPHVGLDVALGAILAFCAGLAVMVVAEMLSPGTAVLKDPRYLTRASVLFLHKTADLSANG